VTTEWICLSSFILTNLSVTKAEAELIRNQKTTSDTKNADENQ
jgi:hypothetical protein